MKLLLDDQSLTPEEIAHLTDADWQARLDPLAYQVLRHKATERPYTGIYTDTDTDGIYRCKGCNARLFESQHKYHSGCGWASFDSASGALDEHFDESHGMRRIEVTCANCGGHLGHVFPDGPKETTGMRYCINSAAIDLDATD